MTIGPLCFSICCLGDGRSSVKSINSGDHCDVRFYLLRTNKQGHGQPTCPRFPRNKGSSRLLQIWEREGAAVRQLERVEHQSRARPYKAEQ